MSIGKELPSGPPGEMLYKMGLPLEQLFPLPLGLSLFSAVEADGAPGLG